MSRTSWPSPPHRRLANYLATVQSCTVLTGFCSRSTIMTNLIRSGVSCKNSLPHMLPLPGIPMLMAARNRICSYRLFAPQWLAAISSINLKLTGAAFLSRVTGPPNRWHPTKRNQVKLGTAALNLFSAVISGKPWFFPVLAATVCRLIVSSCNGGACLIDLDVHA